MRMSQACWKGQFTLILCILIHHASSFSPQHNSVVSIKRDRKNDNWRKKVRPLYSVFDDKHSHHSIHRNVNNHDNNGNNNDNNNIENLQHIHRRDFFRQALSFAVVSSSITIPTLSAEARGLVQFPCTTPLFNTYHIMRAGTTLLEELDIWSTNPLFLTNSEAALSDKGRAEVQAAVQKLKDANIQPSVIKYSLAACAMETTAIVRDELKVGQNRVVPEFFFMDPRAVGRWDMMSYKQTLPAVIAMDEEEAGKDGTGGRPPANEDGTPNETLADNSVRLRQLVSGIESQYSGDTVLLVFPDGTGPALLSAMIAGIPFNKVHELEFAPGELRLDVNMESTLELYKQKTQEKREDYEAMIESGKKELSRLRSLNAEDVVSKKDMLIEKERLEIEEQQRKIQEAREAQEAMEKEARMQRMKEMDDARLRQRGITPGENDEDSTIPPLVIGGAFAAFVGVAFTGGNEGESDGIQGKVTIVDSESPGSKPQRPVLENVPMDMRDVSLEEMIEEQDDYSPLNAPDNDTLDRMPLYAKPPQSDEDRAEAAEKAMRDYIDADDGADAWLQAMTQIIQEEDDDEGDKLDNMNGSSQTNFQ